jgi:hypothetical protein
MPAERLVYYSLATDAGPRASVAVRQLLRSAASLRAHDGDVAVRVYLYGDLPAGDRAELDALDVAVIAAGSSEALVARFCPPRMSEVLARYPVLHKLGSLALLEDERAAQVLYLDSDTFFFRPVGALFDAHRGGDLWAREEKDEDGPGPLFEREGARRITMPNTGVMLMNRGAWRRLAARLPDLFRDVFRFSVWLTAQPSIPDLRDLAHLAAHLARLVTPEDEASALPFPRASAWIREELAFALTLGKIPGFELGLFDRREVLQAEEMFEPGAGEQIVAHYLSMHERDFERWQGARDLAAAPERETARRAIRKLAAAEDAPDRRFFLALLATRPDREAILAAVARRYPEADPCERVRAWIAALSGVDRLGVDAGDPLNREIIAALVDGAGPDALHARLGEAFDPAAVRAQREAIDQHVERIRGTLLGPLFRARG